MRSVPRSLPPVANPLATLVSAVYAGVMKRQGGPPEPKPNATRDAQSEWLSRCRDLVRERGLDPREVEYALYWLVGPTGSGGRTALREMAAIRANLLEQLVENARRDHSALHDITQSGFCNDMDDCSCEVAKRVEGVPHDLVGDVMETQAIYRRRLAQWLRYEQSPAVRGLQVEEYGKLIHRLYTKATLSFRAIALMVEVQRGKKLPLTAQQFENAVESVRSRYYAYRRTLPREKVDGADPAPGERTRRAGAKAPKRPRPGRRSAR
jgi:hypothetical protein